jgi:hypothetical protein
VRQGARHGEEYHPTLNKFKTKFENFWEVLSKISKYFFSVDNFCELKLDVPSLSWL